MSTDCDSRGGSNTDTGDAAWTETRYKSRAEGFAFIPGNLDLSHIQE